MFASSSLTLSVWCWTPYCRFLELLHWKQLPEVIERNADDSDESEPKQVKLNREEVDLRSQVIHRLMRVFSSL